MVQGGSQFYMSKTPSCAGDWDNSARKSGFQALQKKEQEKKEVQKQQEKDKYGAWGPIFKNRDHFNSMHHC